MEEEADIVADLRRKQAVGEKVFHADPDFAADDTSLYADTSALPEYAKVEPRRSTGPHPWLYPHQFASKPQLFKDGTAAGDVVQGQLGDCWLLGAFAAVANHPSKLIERLFLTSDEDFEETGLMTAQMYKDGEWHTVTVDSRIPFGDPRSSLFNSPVYARCSDADEQWVALLEKAYAKMHGCYEKLNGGSVAEALVDLTGGVSQKILLTEPHIKDMVATGRLWSKMKKYLAKDSLLGCSMNVRDGGFEEDAGSGILVNHAYSILHLKEVGRGLKFIKVRNPWGHGEWRGDWSDGWGGWSDHPEVEAALVDDPACGFKRGEDGVFWMVWEDFVSHFNKIYVCRMFGEEYNQYAIKGEWKGLSAAGAQRVSADREERKSSDKRPRQSTVVDGDPRWFCNPQFRVTCSAPCKMFVSLMQSDRKLADKDNNVSIRFSITKVKKSHKSRLWLEDPSELVADSSKYSFSQSFPQREVTQANIHLDPDSAYIVVPHTLQAGIETGFVLRMFSTAELSIAPLVEPYTLDTTGKWTPDTAGGAYRLNSRENPTWCLNPQYWVHSPEAASVPGHATVKVVLERTDRYAGRDDKSDGTKNRTGVVVTRVLPPPVSNPRRRKPGAVRTNALGEPLPTMESSLKKPLGGTATGTMGATGAGAGGADDTLDGSLGVEESKLADIPKRRLEVGAEEFCQSSDFSDAVTATTLLKVPTEWLAAGLLVHPCLRLPGREGEYKLSIHSDFEVEMQELAERSYKTVPGAWVKGKTAHGCHLNPDWKRNPPFEVTVPEGGAQEVRISVGRSDELWLSHRKKDSVGSMIGFYVTTCDAEREPRLNDGRAGLLAETSFVPMRNVSDTVRVDFTALAAANKKLIILPATFEPDKEGPFTVSVSMSCDFDVRPAK